MSIPVGAFIFFIRDQQSGKITTLGIIILYNDTKGKKRIRNHSKGTRIERDGGQIQDNHLLSGFSLSFYCYQRRVGKHYNYSSLLYLEVPASF